MILLTGHEGFIGKNFLSALEGQDIITVEKDDIKTFLEEFDEWEKVSLILHQGAISDTTETDINLIHEYNVNLTLKLFENAIEYGIPVKYASSASIYGNLHEHINPLNYYAISKLQIDYWVLDNIDRFKFIQGFRYFNVYGKGEEHKGDQASPISKFHKELRETAKIKVFEGSDKFLRDFICVDDVVDIVLNNKEKSGIYDLGTGHSVSFEYIAELLVEKYGGKIDNVIEHIPFPEHLKEKYQFFTQADMYWSREYKFTTVEEYINKL